MSAKNYTMQHKVLFAFINFQQCCIGEPPIQGSLSYLFFAYFMYKISNKFPKFVSTEELK